jgi:hypothetical protein
MAVAGFTKGGQGPVESGSPWNRRRNSNRIGLALDNMVKDADHRRSCGQTPARPMRKIFISALIGCLAVVTGALRPAVAQMNDPAYADYFLVGRFGEICTMCEVIVLCEERESAPDYASIPEDGSFTIYHIQTRTFWSQVGTIWEWFISNFDGMAVDGHERPFLVYEVEDGDWSLPREVTARVSLDPPLLAMDEWAIERKERRWLKQPGGQAVGYCQRLPLWESIEIIETRRPKEFPL